MTETIQINLTKEEINVVRNGLSLLVDLDNNHPELIGLSDHAKNCYSNVYNIFTKAYVKDLSDRL